MRSNKLCVYAGREHYSHESLVKNVVVNQPHVNLSCKFNYHFQFFFKKNLIACLMNVETVN